MMIGKKEEIPPGRPDACAAMSEEKIVQQKTAGCPDPRNDGAEKARS